MSNLYVIIEKQQKIIKLLNELNKKLEIENEKLTKNLSETIKEAIENYKKFNNYIIKRRQNEQNRRNYL